MNRLERVSAILIQLQSKPIVTAKEIATQFDISLRTVYRDIRTLEEAGIPLIGNTGVGYSLVDGFRLPPLMFSREEAIAFLTAEKLVEKLTDTTNAKHFKSGMNKVRSVLRFVEKDYLSEIEDTIQVLGFNHLNSALPSDIIQILLSSISNRKVIQISYFTSYRQELTERRIEPIGYFYSQNHWYLIAYCRNRKDYRCFRIDRIKSFKTSDEKFEDKHPTLSDFIKDYRQGENSIGIILRLKTEDVYKINNYKYTHGLLKEIEIDNFTDLHFITFDLEHFARWFLSFADIAEIISPFELKTKVRDILNKIEI